MKMNGLLPTKSPAVARHRLAGLAAVNSSYNAAAHASGAPTEGVDVDTISNAWDAAHPGNTVAMLWQAYLKAEAAVAAYQAAVAAYQAAGMVFATPGFSASNDQAIQVPNYSPRDISTSDPQYAAAISAGWTVSSTKPGTTFGKPNGKTIASIVPPQKPATYGLGASNSPKALANAAYDAWANASGNRTLEQLDVIYKGQQGSQFQQFTSTIGAALTNPIAVGLLTFGAGVAYSVATAATSTQAAAQAATQITGATETAAASQFPATEAMLQAGGYSDQAILASYAAEGGADAAAAVGSLDDAASVISAASATAQTGSVVSAVTDAIQQGSDALKPLQTAASTAATAESVVKTGQSIVSALSPPGGALSVPTATAAPSATAAGGYLPLLLAGAAALFFSR